MERIPEDFRITDQMSRSEALRLLALYRDWDVEQVSVDLALSGRRTAADAVYDERRVLLVAAARRLMQSEVGPA